MPVDIKNVLVCDAVDSACVDLLKENSINVMLQIPLPLLKFIIYHLGGFCVAKVFIVFFGAVVIENKQNVI